MLIPPSSLAEGQQAPTKEKLDGHQCADSRKWAKVVAGADESLSGLSCFLFRTGAFFVA